MADSINPQRRHPVQRRSRERVNLILDVTAELLREVGTGGVKTTEIARRANIKLASLYRYFPNKNAILEHLARRQMEKLMPALEQFLVRFDLDQGLEQLIEDQVRLFREETGFGELWRGLQAIPELQQLEIEDLLGNAELVSEKAAAAAPHLAADKLWRISVVMLQTISAILRLESSIDDPRTNGLTKELESMLRLYLSNQLNQVHHEELAGAAL